MEIRILSTRFGLYSFMIHLKALWIILSETINILRKLHKTNISRCPRKFYHRVVYIAPSSGHEWLKLSLPLKLILRRFEVVFWCLDSPDSGPFYRLQLSPNARPADCAMPTHRDTPQIAPPENSGSYVRIQITPAALEVVTFWMQSRGGLMFGV